MELPPRLAHLPRRELAGGLVVVEAATAGARLRGLARLDAPAPEIGLHLPRCRSIHTFGMRFALDLVWLDGDGEVVRVDVGVPRRRQRSAHRRARSVLEVGAGQAEAFLAAGLVPHRP
ncbi:MAG: hypothetical protein JWR63_214 [Conexibacter sp.]|nr:hypothetical protein [Conexibacter sp.]